MKTEILTLLKNQKDYLSGQELCRKFGVSRTAVWKVINQLKEEGYEIESVSHRGYRLQAVPDILSESELKSCLHTKWLGSELHTYETIDSTNTEAKRLAEGRKCHGMLVTANMQVAGKGRRGRTWQQEPGTTISMSIALQPAFSPDKASMLTLLAAHSVALSVNEVLGERVQIKWPNDIVLHGKKICGILTEMSAEMDFIHYVVVGIGINVSSREFPEEIKDTATSLFKETGKMINRCSLIAAVAEHFEQDYEAFLKTEDLSGILKEYNDMLINKDAAVKVLDPKGEFEGTARGINAAGELLVEKEGTGLVTVYAGEVSVRGLYGYV